jgi:hypothetical protein
MDWSGWIHLLADPVDNSHDGCRLHVLAIGDAIASVSAL